MTDCSYNKRKTNSFQTSTEWTKKQYGEPLCEKHFAEAMRLLCRKGGPLADRTTKEIALPDLESLVG